MRIPLLQDIVRDVFLDQKDIFKTLNMDECIAQGTAISCAVVSPCYQVPFPKLKDMYPHDVKICVNQKYYDLVKKGDNFPLKKSINLRQDSDFKVQAKL